MKPITKTIKSKDSGVEWIGKIPEHWEVWKVSHAFKVVGSGTTPKSDRVDYYFGETPWVTTSELRETLITGTKEKLSDLAIRDYPTLRKYPVGTLLIAMYGATIGRLGILGIEAVVNQACCAFANSEIIDTKFFYYWLIFYRPILISLSSGGGQPNLNQEELKSLRVPIPPLEEQKAIAEMLDRETARLDELIAEKERLLKLLVEKRRAIITHAVTRGLDENAKLKDSGIEWLGKIPAHWGKVRLKFLASKIGSGKTPLGGAENYAKSGIPFIRSQNVITEGLSMQDIAFIDNETHEQMKSSRVLADDVLLNITGASIGRSCVVPSFIKEANVNQHVCIIRPNIKRLVNNYLNLFLISVAGQAQIFLGEVGISREGLTFEAIGDFIISIPPIHEQKKIVDFIESETHKIDSLQDVTKSTIELLKERRSSLITAAVTGKIKVT